MKKILTLLIGMALTMASFAQNETHKWGFGAQISAVDFSGPITKSYFDFDEYHGLARFFASRYLNSSFDLTLDMSLGKVWAPSIANYPDGLAHPALERHMYDWGLVGEYKFNNGYIFKEDAIIAPYIFTGIGMNWLVDYPFKSHEVNAYIPFGLGLDIRATDWLTFNMQSSYKLALDNHFDYTQHSAGIVVNFGRGAEKAVDKTKEKDVVDSDADGVPDLIDECPFAAGSSDLFGCPDSDGDGLGDSRDDCPQLAGTKMNRGCPSMDSDNDGVADDKDNCPDVAGLPRYSGCPDTDGDGIIDKYDNCPNERGVASNNGCPKPANEVVEPSRPITQPTRPVTPMPTTPIDADAKYLVYFSTGSDFLDNQQTRTIDKVANMMKSNPDMLLNINGYADNRGSEEANMTLSLERGIAVWQELAKRGVTGDRVVIYAFGEYFPRSTSLKENRVVELAIQER